MSGIGGGRGRARSGGWAAAVVMLLAVTALTGCSTASSPSTFAGPTPPPFTGAAHLFRALAGSENHVVYAEYAVAAGGAPAKVGTLYDWDGTASRRRIGTVGQAGTVKLAGTMLLWRRTQSADVWQWVELRTGKHGTVPVRPARPALPAGDDGQNEVVSAAPGGWIIEQTMPSRTESDHAGPAAELYLETTDGHLSRLGAPRSTFTAFGVQADARALVTSEVGAADFNTGAVTTMRFDQPGTFTELFPSREGAASSCSAPDGDLVACTVEKTLTDRRQRLYTIDGRLLSDVKTDCGFTPAVLGQQVAWLEPRGGACDARLHVGPGIDHATTNGFPTIANEAGPVAAFGGLVVGSDQRGAFVRELVFIDPSLHERVVAR